MEYIWYSVALEECQASRDMAGDPFLCSCTNSGCQSYLQTGINDFGPSYVFMALYQL